MSPFIPPAEPAAALPDACGAWNGQGTPRTGTPSAQVEPRPLSAAALVGKQNCGTQDSPGRFSARAQARKDEKGFLFLASENTARTSLREENRFVQFIWIKGGPGEPLPQRQALWSWPGLQAGRLICHRRSLGTGSRAPGIVITSFTQEALMEYSCKLAQIGLCSWLCF